MRITYNRRFFIYVLISIIIFTIVIVPIYNKYVGTANIENFEDPQKIDEVISRLEFITSRLEKLIPEKTVVVETPTVHIAKDIAKDTAKDTTKNTTKEVTTAVKVADSTEKYVDNKEDDEGGIKETFVSPQKKMSNIQGYDSYLYDSYYMNLD